MAKQNIIVAPIEDGRAAELIKNDVNGNFMKIAANTDELYTHLEPSLIFPSFEFIKEYGEELYGLKTIISPCSGSAQR